MLLKELPSQRSKNWVKQVNIRLLTQDDLPALEWDGKYIHFRRLYQEAYQRYLRGISLLWVADLAEIGVLGQVFIQLSCDREELADGISRAYLYAFRIKPKYRNAGLGTRMVQAIEQDLLERGFSTITLNVAKSNEKAIRLYQRLGFTITGHEPGLWSYIDHLGKWRNVHEPGWRMEKKIQDI